MSEQPKCKECEGTFLTWSLSLRSTTNIAGHNRLGLHNVVVDAVLGCEECSATVMVIDGQKLVDEMVTAATRLHAEAAELRAQLASAKAEVERLEVFIRGIANRENPEHYGNARDELHLVIKSCKELLDGPDPGYDALTPPAQQQEKHTTHPEGGSREA